MRIRLTSGVDDRLRGVLLATGGMVLLSTDSLFIRLADADTSDVLFWVGALTAVVMFGFLALRDRTSPLVHFRPNGRFVVAAGVLQAAMLVLFVAAVQETSVANVMVIVAAAPLAAAVISWWLLREHTTRRVWVAIVATAAGVGVVISGSVGGGSLAGDLYAVGAIVTFGFSAVLLRRYPAISRPAVVGLGGLVMAVATAWPATIAGHSLETWLALVAMGAVFGPLARVMISSAPRYLPATEVALFGPLETVLGTLWAFAAFGETPAARTWVGGAIIVTAVLWGVWPRRRPAHPRPRARAS